MRILLVDDEPELAEALVEVLTDDRHTVDHAADGETAAQLKADRSYDLVVLDWSIPAPTGIELLRRWRESGDGTPVLMLTGDRTRVRDKVEGLDVGADDYLTKPFAIAEFRARVRSLLRRRERAVQTVLQIADLEMNTAAHTVTLDGSPVHLSPKEFALLEYLMLRKDQVVRRDELYEHAWSEAYDPASNVIDVMIHRIRRKIDGDRETRLLQTVPGIGYVLRDRRG